MKRVTISVQSITHPEVSVMGYALPSELKNELLQFYTTLKLPLEDELQVTVHYHGSVTQFRARMRTLNEQISSGRVMSDTPSEENPLPIRTFYKCYATVISKEVSDGQTDGASIQSRDESNVESIHSKSNEAAQSEEAVQETPAETPAAEASEASPENSEDDVAQAA